MQRATYLLSPTIQMLLCSRNILTDTPSSNLTRDMVSPPQGSGHKIEHHKACRTVWLEGGTEPLGPLHSSLLRPMLRAHRSPPGPIAWPVTGGGSLHGGSEAADTGGTLQLSSVWNAAGVWGSSCLIPGPYFSIHTRSEGEGLGLNVSPETDVPIPGSERCPLPPTDSCATHKPILATGTVSKNQFQKISRVRKSHGETGYLLG